VIDRPNPVIALLHGQAVRSDCIILYLPGAIVLTQPAEPAALLYRQVEAEPVRPDVGRRLSA